MRFYFEVSEKTKHPVTSETSSLSSLFLKAADERKDVWTTGLFGLAAGMHHAGSSVFFPSLISSVLPPAPLSFPTQIIVWKPLGAIHS